jgi:hypothetical protein
MNIEHMNELIRLTSKRTEFLEKHPDLIDFQKKINDTLDEVGSNPIERCVVLQHIMAQSSYELSAKVKDVLVDVEELRITLDELIAEHRKD